MVDTTIPIITLVGANPQTIEVGSPYVELGATALDNYDGDITASVVVDASAVNTSVVGSYAVTNDVTDSSGNVATQITRTVDVVDTTIPTMTLVGSTPVVVEVGSSYVELGATALDNYDGDITSSIVTDASAVNTAAVGSYAVTYDVTDSSSNAGVQVTRTVDVVDTGIPVISLVGANPQTIQVGSPYVELGATALDNYDGDITGSIVTDASAVNTSVVGSYTVTYNVVDANGNAAPQITRTVEVLQGNGTPTAVDDSYDVAHGATIAVGVPGVLANDTDADGDALSARLIRAPSFGSLTLNSDGSFVYTSEDDPYEIVDSFEYEVFDSTGASDRGEVTINVTNSAPVAVADVITMDEDTIAAIDATANDTDEDADRLTISGVISASVGAVTRAVDGTLTFEPPPDYHGPVEVSYNVVDGFGGAAVGQILIAVLPVNDAPVPAGDFVSFKRLRAADPRSDEQRHRRRRRHLDHGGDDDSRARIRPCHRGRLSRLRTRTRICRNGHLPLRHHRRRKCAAMGDRRRFDNAGGQRRSHRIGRNPRNRDD